MPGVLRTEQSSSGHSAYSYLRALQRGTDDTVSEREKHRNRQKVIGKNIAAKKAEALSSQG
jgi:hypothetical protein